MRTRLPEFDSGGRGRRPQARAGARRAFGQAASVARIHRSRHARHRSRSHADALGESRACSRRPRPHEQGSQALHCGAARIRRRFRQGAHRDQHELLDHPEAERGGAHGRRAGGPRPSALRRLRGGEQKSRRARNHQRYAPHHRGGAVRNREGASRRALSRAARARGVGRRLARRREGHRGEQAREHVRRAGAPLHNRWRRGARFGPQRRAGEPVQGGRRSIRSAHSLRWPRSRRRRDASGRQASRIHRAFVRASRRASARQLPPPHRDRCVRRSIGAYARKRGGALSACPLRAGESGSSLPRPRRYARGLSCGGGREEPLLLPAFRRQAYGCGHHVPLLRPRNPHALRQRSQRSV